MLYSNNLVNKCDDCEDRSLCQCKCSHLHLTNQTVYQVGQVYVCAVYDLFCSDFFGSNFDDN